MNEAVLSSTARLAATAMWLLMGGYLLALFDWARATPNQIRPASRASVAWLVAALLLVAVMAAINGVAFGWNGAVAFASGPGRAPLSMAFGVVFLQQAGQRWAGELDAKPFRAGLWRWRRWPWRWLAVSLAAMLAWTLATSALAPHKLTSERMTQWLRLDAMSPWLRMPMAIALLTLAPILEESFFRHYLLYRLAAALTRAGTSRTWAAASAIVLTSALFAIGHMGMIEPFWLKWLQTFAPGLILGATAWRHGLESAIALHWAFNVSVFLLALAHGF